jgi:hypothetical protein
VRHRRAQLHKEEYSIYTYAPPKRHASSVVHHRQTCYFPLDFGVSALQFSRRARCNRPESTELHRYSKGFPQLWKRGNYVNIKGADVIAKKYATRGGAAAQDYSAGVAAPRVPWAAATAAAVSTYASGVQQSIANGSFVKGVTAAGDAKWSRKATTVGAARYGPGVQAAQQDYASGVAPYLQVLSSLQLPPRGPKGDPGNVQRVNAIAQALRAKKLGG